VTRQERLIQSVNHNCEKFDKLRGLKNLHERHSTAKKLADVLTELQPLIDAEDTDVWDRDYQWIQLEIDAFIEMADTLLKFYLINPHTCPEPDWLP